MKKEEEEKEKKGEKIGRNWELAGSFYF